MTHGRAGRASALAAALVLLLALLARGEGAVVAAAATAAAEPAAARASVEGNPTGWRLFSPCDRNCAVAVYAGHLVEDSMSTVLYKETSFPTRWNYDPSDRFVGFAFSRHAASFWRFGLEPELGVGQRLDQDVTEGWAALYLRYRGFPWDSYLLTSVAVSTGVNVASSVSEWESERSNESGGFKVMHFFSPEVTFALPSHPETELLFRFHHRSGAFGVFNEAGGGAQYGSVGLRFRF